MNEGKNTNEIKFNLVLSLFLFLFFFFLVSEEWWEKISFLCWAVFSLYHLSYSSCSWSLFIWKNLIFALYSPLEKGKWHKLKYPNRSRECCISSLLYFSLCHVFLVLSRVFCLVSALGMLDLEVMGRKSKSAVLGLSQKLVVLGVAMYNKNTNVGNKIEVRIFLLKEVAHNCLQAAHCKGNYNSIPCPPGHMDLSCM